jgi:hypothetical protein
VTEKFLLLSYSLCNEVPIEVENLLALSVWHLKEAIVGLPVS